MTYGPLAPRLTVADDWMALVAQEAGDVLTLRTTYGQYVAVSPSCRHVYGFDAEELTGQDGYRFVHPDDVDMMQGCHEALLEGKRVLVTFRHQRKDGSYVWVESTTVRTDFGGHPRGVIVGVARDVSTFPERHQAGWKVLS